MELSEKIFQALKEKKISIKDLNDQYFINSQDKIKVDNMLKLLNENICSFQQIVDRFKSIKNTKNNPRLYSLLENIEFFEELIENKITNDDLKYLLNRIDNWYELDYLCENTSLINRILNEFVLDKETVDRLNMEIESIDWHKKANIYTIFDLIEYETYYNEETLKLSKLNKTVYLLNIFNLNENQRNELIEILRNNEQARNTLIQIVETNLEDQYNFESLKNLLTKNNEKKKIKMNI